VQEFINQSVTANPHFWYSSYYVNDTMAAMHKNLVCIDPAYTAYLHQQYASLNTPLWQDYMSLEVQIKQKFGGAPVAFTKSIFAYMANATGLNVVSPAGFMEAVSEGNDPSAQDVATMKQLTMGGNSTVRVLDYNNQTVTPLTEDIKSLAAQYYIPTIGVTETIQPTNTTFQLWMGGELNELYNALNASALGK
jgi:zinc/manganese transport system substrate-binding protein